MLAYVYGELSKELLKDGGDHLQFPLTIESVEAEKKGLGGILFERLADLYGDEVMSMLIVQYRNA